MNRELRLWRPEDFEDTCESCGAPPGQFCRDSCDVGYSAALHHKAIADRENRTRA